VAKWADGFSALPPDAQITVVSRLNKARDDIMRDERLKFTPVGAVIDAVSGLTAASGSAVPRIRLFLTKALQQLSASSAPPAERRSTGGGAPADTPAAAPAKPLSKKKQAAGVSPGGVQQLAAAACSIAAAMSAPASIGIASGPQQLMPARAARSSCGLLPRASGSALLPPMPAHMRSSRSSCGAPALRASGGAPMQRLSLLRVSRCSSDAIPSPSARGGGFAAAQPLPAGAAYRASVLKPPRASDGAFVPAMHSALAYV
jgi:hypothetical protein